MRDLKSHGLIKLKAILFLLSGMLASALLLVDRPSLRNAFLLTVAVWSFCRLHYFLFYVIQHYLDPDFRFVGLMALVRKNLVQRKV